MNSFSQICAPQFAYRNHFSIGGLSVDVAGQYPADVRLMSALSRFETSVAGCDIEVVVEHVSSLPEPTASSAFDSGSVWRLSVSNDGFWFDFATPVLGDAPYKRLVTDREFRHAALLVQDGVQWTTPELSSPWEYPVDELLVMHRLTQEHAIELHGCGIVGPRGAANLFVGHSGAGKSTTARLWTARHDVEILSDDRIIVRRDPVQRHAAPILMYGTPWHGEGQFASPASAALCRICVLEHGHGNVLTRLSPSQAVAELFARSFVPFHRHEYVESALAFLEELASEVPCYRYSFEPDQRAVEKILNFHD